MSGNFLLFVGQDDGQGGGWHDYVGRFNTINEALHHFSGMDGDWMHIVDLAKGEIVEPKLQTWERCCRCGTQVKNPMFPFCGQCDKIVEALP